jgi:hypothetical protein
MFRRSIVLSVLAAALGFAAACADTSTSLSPTPPPANTIATANSDGSTLKVTAPSPTAPSNNTTLDSGVVSAQLQAAAATLSNGGSAALSYRFEVYKGTAVTGTPVQILTGAVNGSAVAATTTGSLDYATAYTWRVRAESGTAVGPWSAARSFTTGAAPQPRRDANAFGGKIPRSIAIADLNATVFKVAAANPSVVQETCVGPVDGARDNRNDVNFPIALLTVLRTQFDNRWGFNCIRGNCNDPAAKVVDYHWAPGPSEGSTSVYVFQVISGACQPEVSDVTDVTFGAGTVGRYSLLQGSPFMNGLVFTNLSNF